MPAIDIRETGLNSTDPTLVNQNYQLYSSYNDDAAKYRYPLPETAPDAPENKERMEFVRKLREPVTLNMDASVKLKRKLEADLEKELFGESMKVFNETNPFDRDNFNLFIGEKYLDPSVRIRKAHDMPFSVDRSAVSSISVLLQF